MQYIDQPKTGRYAIMSPEMAVVSGKISTSSVDDLRQFEKAFPFDPRVVIAVAQDVLAREQVKGPVSPDQARSLLSPREKSDIVFKELLPRIYKPDAAGGWASDIHFQIEGVGDYTVSVKPDGVKVSEGKVGAPDSEVVMDAVTFEAVMRFEALDDSGLLDDVTVVDDEKRSEELTDKQLELVAGGKATGCGAAACSGDSGAALCGAAAGDQATCGAALYVTAACSGAACGADACGAALTAATACGGAACGAATAAITGCGGAACAAAAAASAACGAAACAAAACAGDYCGAAICSAAACAGNICGLDLAPGPDVGPCAINVLPVIPFL